MSPQMNRYPGRPLLINNESQLQEFTKYYWEIEPTSTYDPIIPSRFPTPWYLFLTGCSQGSKKRTATGGGNIIPISEENTNYKNIILMEGGLFTRCVIEVHIKFLLQNVHFNFWNTCSILASSWCVHSRQENYLAAKQLRIISLIILKANAFLDSRRTLKPPQNNK